MPARTARTWEFLLLRRSFHPPNLEVCSRKISENQKFNWENGGIWG